MKKSPFFPSRFPLRRAALVFGCIVALCTGFTVWSHRSAQADSPNRTRKTTGHPQDSSGPMTYGEAQTVGPGTTISVADLMATEKKRPRSKDETERFTKNEYEFFMERRGTLKQNPASALSANWPPTSSGPATDTPSAIDPIRNSPQTVGQNILGVSRTEAGGFTPPDSHGAVGPTQVIVTANVYMKSFNKTTGLPDGILNLSLSTFFAAAPGGIGAGLSDPRVKFDPISRRWFISIITVDTSNRILLAVSSGPDITGTSSFTFFSFAATDGGGAESQTPFADYDTLGIDARGVYICANIFNTAGNASLGATVFVINKANLLSATPTLTVTAFRQLNNGSGPGPSVPYVADNPDPAATEAYLVGTDNASLGLLVLRRITGAGTPTPAISDNLNVTVPATAAPINVPVLNRTQSNLDALDDRLFEAKVRNGRLWTAHNIGVNSSGVATTPDRTGSRWYEIGTLSTTPTLIQSGTLFSSAATNPDFFWIPSIGITGQGHAALACSAAGFSRFTDIVYAGRLSGDAAGTLRTPTTAVAATSSYTSTSSRWGDYSHVATDPNDDMTMWTFQEYGTGTSIWGVRAIQLVAPPPATLTSISPTSATQGQTLNITVNGTSANGSGFYSPSAPFPNKLAANFGTGVTVNSVTFNSPTQAVFNVTVQGGATTGIRNVTVTNPDGQATTANNLFTVNAGCAAPISVAPSTLPNGLTNVAYVTQTLSATGGVASYNFALAAGTLPTGLTLSSGGVLSGTPTVAGTFTFTVVATDNAGCTGATTYAVTIGSPALSQGAVTVTTGNNLIEPNECNSLTITLANGGTADAAGVTATLSSSTPGVTVTTATSAYPLIAVGGAAQTNTTAFQVSTANTVACLSTINFTLTVTYTGGSTSFNFTKTVGQVVTNYAFTSTTGATIPGTPGAGVLVAGTQNDDAVAPVTLPGFAFSVYGTTVTSLTVDTNGNLRINGGGASSVTNGTLPSGTFPTGSPVLLPYWDDLDMSPTVTTGGGVYTQTVGSAPNRQFVVEWRARHWINGQALGGVDTNFAIVFREGSNQFSYVYALAGAGSFIGGVDATVGVQADTTGTTFTQFSVNTASLSAGQRLDAAIPPNICNPGSGGCAVACTYQVAPTSTTIIASPGSATVTVTAGNGCQWTAQSNAAWLTILSGTTGNGNGTVQVRIALNNTAAPRTGTLTVAGQTVTFNQSRPNAATPGQYRPSNGFVYVKNTNETGFADTEFFYGTASDQPIAGDWDGNGTDTIGIYRNGTFFLRNSNTSGFADIQFPFGAPGDIPLAGDWDGDGVDTVGVVRGNIVFLKNSNTSGNADLQFAYGTATDRFITGDWNGDGVDTIGCFRPSDGFVYLRNTNTTGVADFLFFYGQASDKPVVGDWNGDGVDTIGIVRGNQWFLRNTNTSGFADIQFFYGTDTDVPIAGDWDGQP